MPQNSTRCWYFAGHREVGEDQRPDEDVVDAEALLDQVAGEVLAGGRRRRTTTSTTSEKPSPIEIHTADSIAASRGVDLVRLAVEHQEVEQQQRDDDARAGTAQCHSATSRSTKLVLGRSSASDQRDVTPIYSFDRPVAAVQSPIAVGRDWRRRRWPGPRRGGRSARGTASS